MRCDNVTRGVCVADVVVIADSFFSRLLGLMFRKSLGRGRGLFLTRCPSIHTCFMRFDIDAVFLDRSGKAVYIARRMRPWRFSPWVKNAENVLEMEGGALDGNVEEGDVLMLS